MSRELLPDRRSTWTQKATIAEAHEKPQTFYLSFGEYEDGRLGEIWIEAQKENTFARGVLAALARTMSIALQHNVPVEAIVASLRGLDFSPRGKVSRTPTTDRATSICDWIAQEIQAAYVKPPTPATPTKSATVPPSVPSPSSSTSSATVWRCEQAESWPYTYLLRDGAGDLIFSVDPYAFSSSDTQQQVNAKPENLVLQRRLQAIARLPNVVRVCVKTIEVLNDLLVMHSDEKLSPWSAADFTRLVEEMRAALSGVDVDCL